MVINLFNFVITIEKQHSNPEKLLQIVEQQNREKELEQIKNNMIGLYYRFF